MINGMVNFPFLDSDIPRHPSYGVYVSQLIRFARASSHATDFNNRNKFLTAKLLKQSYRYHKLPNSTQSEEPKKFVGIFEYILASMLKVFLNM